MAKVREWLQDKSDLAMELVIGDAGSGGARMPFKSDW